jgi:hypothetical protein
MELFDPIGAQDGTLQCVYQNVHRCLPQIQIYFGSIYFYEEKRAITHIEIFDPMAHEMAAMALRGQCHPDVIIHAAVAALCVIVRLATFDGFLLRCGRQRLVVHLGRFGIPDTNHVAHVGDLF